MFAVVVFDGMVGGYEEVFFGSYEACVAYADGDDELYVVEYDD